MILKGLENYNLILASGSPRRQQFFKDMGLDVQVQLKEVKEEYPNRLRHFEISDYLAQLKALAFEGTLAENDILITSDTIVWHEQKALGKPRDHKEAYAMLRSMSGTTHEVITSVSFTTCKNQKTVHAVTKVRFKVLSDEEINHYIENYQPFDKAGAYGIQEWIGQIGITNIEGSYTNVVGLPTHLVYQTLQQLVN